jgi:hypothetical protein
MNRITSVVIHNQVVEERKRSPTAMYPTDTDTRLRPQRKPLRLIFKSPTEISDLPEMLNADSPISFLYP